MLPLHKTPLAALVLLIPVIFATTPAVAGESEAKSATAAKSPEKKPSPADPVVKVNGASITRLDLDRALKVLLASAGSAGELPPEVAKQAEAQALEQLVAAELLYQEGEKAEGKDLEKRISARMDQNKARFHSAEEYQKMLQSLSLTDKEMVEFTRKDVVINDLIETRFASKATVSDEEAKKFYDDNLQKFFTQQESMRASHILIGTKEGASAEEKQKAKEKAAALLKKIKAGADFAEVAKSDSTCPSSTQGGDLGTFTKGQMVPGFEKAAFALKPGELSDVVETEFGYHIIKATEKKEGSVQKYDEVKEKIVEFLKREKTQKSISSLIEQLKAKAQIERL